MISMQTSPTMTADWPAPQTATGSRASLRAATDEALLERCARGDEAALQDLMARYQRPIYRLFAQMLGSVEDAEELTLQVFWRAWKSAERFQYRSKVDTWLYRIAINLAHDTHKRRQSSPPPVSLEMVAEGRLTAESAEETALDQLRRDEQAHALRNALARLRDTDRLLLVLYYLEGREYADIQAITGYNYPVLKTRLARARRRLQSLLERDAMAKG